MAFTIRDSGFLLSRIEEQLADNNAGLISAADVRDNIGDAVRSINAIVSSGDTSATFPFYNDVRAKLTVPLVGSAYGGTFIAESGILFPNASDAIKLQVRPFLGVSNLQHNELAGLTTADPHTQYVSISGHRPMLGNLRMASYWIGSSGIDNDGLKFQYHPTGTTILTSGTFKFPDNSRLGSAMGVAKAFVTFDGTTGARYNNFSHNIYSITRLMSGKYEIKVSSGVLGSDNYTVFAHSNARSTANSREDFDRNTTCSIVRSGISITDGTNVFTVCTLNELGNYADGKIVDVVVFGSGT